MLKYAIIENEETKECNEVWLKIDGFDNYEASSNGKIRSLNYKNTGKVVELKPIDTMFGYHDITLYDRKVKQYKRFKLHRIIAKTFIKNDENKKEVNHKNGIRTDNRVDNLEWNTRLENSTHSWKYLNRKSSYGFMGKKHTEEAIKKLSDDRKINNSMAVRNKCLETGDIFYSFAEAARFFNIKQFMVERACRNNKKTTSGLSFIRI